MISGATVCNNANKLQDCNEILRRAEWIPSFDEWSQRLSLEYHHIFPWEATHFDPPPKIIKISQRDKRPIVPQLDLRGMDMEEKYPHQVAVFYQFRNKQDEMAKNKVREALLYTSWAREAAKSLHHLGIDFLYGMLYRNTFELQERFQSPSTSTKEGLRYSFVLHSRHIHDDVNGCKIQHERQCLQQVLADVPPKQQVWATLMSDRTCTINKIRKWLEDRNVTVEIAAHDNGKSYRSEHGPFAGVGFFQDMELASQARDAFIGTKNIMLNDSLLRSSSNLVLEVMEYEKQMEAWRSGKDVEDTKLCVIDHEV